MQIIYLFSELLPCLLIGFFLGKYRKDLSLLVTRPLIQFGIPISLMGLLLKSHMSLSLIKAAAMASIVIGLMIIMMNCIPQFKEKIAERTLQLGSCFGNTGYFGLPVSLTLLPSQAFIYSVGYDLGATIILWCLGPLFLASQSNTLNSNEYKERLIQAVNKSPAIKAIIGAIIIQSTPWQETISSWLWIPSRIVITLAIGIVGMHMGQMINSNLPGLKSKYNQITISLFIKLLGFPIFTLGISEAFQLPKLMTEALVLQAAAPTAVSVLLISKGNLYNEELATFQVVVSTLAALITIPIWSLILKL